MSNYHNPTKRVLDIFIVLAKNSEGLTFTEISNKTEIPKSTLSPILKTMSDMDFLSFNNSIYKIGINAFKLGNSYMNSTEVMEIIQKHMQSIVEECNEICQLGIYTDEGVLYLEKIEPNQAIKLVSSVGQTQPLYPTALGKALLSQYDDFFIRDNFDYDFKIYTDKTVRNVDELIDDINFVRENGYAVEKGELTKDIQCVAVPLEQNGSIFAAISVSMPSFRTDDDKIKDIANILLDHKIKIEDEIVGLTIDF